jgi:DNA-binding PadR family transcriptional regulator
MSRPITPKKGMERAGSRRRRFYRLTPKGRRRLDQQRRAWVLSRRRVMVGFDDRRFGDAR